MNTDLAVRYHVHFSSESAEWETPQDLFDKINSVCNFTLDVCATHENAKCARHLTIEDDGLWQGWDGMCWMNPPYGREIGLWMGHAYNESMFDGTAIPGTTVVCLVPARTDTAWWHNFAMKGEIIFIRGRLKFNKHKNSAPFPSAIVIFGDRSVELRNLIEQKIKN